MKSAIKENIDSDKREYSTKKEILLTGHLPDMVRKQEKRKFILPENRQPDIPDGVRLHEMLRRTDFT